MEINTAIIPTYQYAIQAHSNKNIEYDTKLDTKYILKQSQIESS